MSDGTGDDAAHSEGGRGHDPDATEPHWLSDDQQRAWLALIALVMRLPAALDTQLQRDSSMTHFEYFVLVSLSAERDGRLQLSVLAQRANSSLSRLSHVVTKLEKRGWVRREPVPGSRASDAVLTEEGTAKIVEAAPQHVKTVRNLVFDGLSARQVGQLERLAESMVTQLDKAIASGVGRP
ncbi:MarR family transcriptional regulator [Rhodococcus triatomae]|uniref:DNA-binding transcriptional regulator, MarR family n=1 Tax=Rhodococcus triatomae TaxID=300028 RepID=A0A1G8CSF3_9NOCA|nr:MarR family transcriptional regulator [Rhodococcus triatomae]QNG18585.1 MarR family transcriptional regulator [Rhodococcus triatomae]QNG21746.1 MarR family transcriptional regulator [Rhodococcus triatomae]SDH48382.1 DNA-binding transcriptional regulator, MarR family [Rhodococcus triatomae]